MTVSFSSFAHGYMDELTQKIKELDVVELEKFVEAIVKTEGKIYIIGNGGSSATASHMANDLSIGLKRRGKKALDAVSLSDNSAVCFAIANDIGFENTFYMQLKDIVTPKDLVIAISCSGNSDNIVKAVEYAKSEGVSIVGITGFDGGALKELSDIKIHIETAHGKYGIVEDLHLMVNHMVYSYLLESL